MTNSGAIYQNGPLHPFSSRTRDKRTNKKISLQYQASALLPATNRFKLIVQIEKTTVSAIVDMTRSQPPNPNRIISHYQQRNKQVLSNFESILAQLLLQPKG